MPTDAPAVIGQRIADARRTSGLTQQALASAVSLDRTAISKIESGRRGLSSAELGRVARALGRPLESFLGDKPPPRAMTLRDLRRRRRAILRIAKHHGARSVRVFGSVARGDSDAQSDVDLLVKMGPGTTLLDLAGILVDLRDLLGRDVDVVTPEALRDRIRTRVLREAVAL